MEKSKYDIEKVLHDLKTKGCQIKGAHIDIEVPYKSERIGNKTWGKLDFLIRNGFEVEGFAPGFIGSGLMYKPVFEKKD